MSQPANFENEYRKRREGMVERQLRRRGIKDANVLQAMERVPRHRFVPSDLIDAAYYDQALQIGQGQTISQPYVVALMTELARPQPESRALDVGSGSGYQAAVLAEICNEVHGVEIVEELFEETRRRLDSLGYDNIALHLGDGRKGWTQAAPYDVIIVAAAGREIPPALLEQLAPSGRLIAPVGEWRQELQLVEKQEDGSLRETNYGGVAFVPLVGEDGGA